jgi:hypothetical protein
MYLERPRKTTKNVSQDSRCRGRDSNWAHPEYMWTVLLLQPTCSCQRYFFYLVCEAIGTAANSGLLCQPRVIVKVIVEKQMECRLAGETEVLGENLPQRDFCPSQNPTWPDPGLNPGRRGGKPATNRLSYGAALKKKNPPHRDSNPRRSGLQHSALTTWGILLLDNSLPIRDFHQV